MAWKQVKGFNQAAAGKVAGYCLQNVRKGYGIAAKYPTALEAWKHTQQHRDRNIPGGVDVPIYYDYFIRGTNYGHINVKLANGKVWSDGEMFSSVADYEAKRAPTYLGWGESVNGVSVIQWFPDPAPSPPPSKLPPIGSKIKLIPPQTRTTWKVGTATKAGTIRVTDNTFTYTVRGYDDKYPGRIVVNSAMGGGNGVGLALWYNNGSLIEGWVRA